MSGVAVMDEITPKSTGQFGKGNPGKPKGATNKVNNDIKSMILEALSNAGGAEYLTRKANDPKTAAAFLGLIGKVLPMTIAGDPNSPLVASLTVTFVGEA